MRAALSGSRAALLRPGIARPRARLPVGAQGSCVTRASLRFYADTKPDKTVLPGTQSKTAPNAPSVPASPASNAQAPASPPTPATPSSSSVIPPENIPKPPPSPTATKQTAPPTSIPPTSTAGPGSSAPPLPPPRKKRRPGRFLLYLITLVSLSYAGGTYYSLINDNFHDFFTEFVPFGEDAVLFFEEREFRRRFPNSTSSSNLYPQVKGENKVNISGKSGVSAKVSNGQTSDLGSKGKHMSAVEDEKPKLSDSPVSKYSETDKASSKPAQAKKTDSSPKNGTGKTADQAADKSQAKADTSTAKEKSGASSNKKKDTAQSDSKSDSKSKESGSTTTSPTPSAAPIALVDPVSVKNAQDPVVQSITKMLNDVITVINADGASGKYSSAISKAKEDLTKLAGELTTLRETEAKQADEKIQQTEKQYREGAEELIRRLEFQSNEQELRWREEYQAERERLLKSYEDRLKAEVEAAKQVAEQKLRNELLEQDIRLKDSFSGQVRDRVETERNARLSKLSELSSSVEGLEKLALDFNDTVNANQKTQHLIVAVETVRSLLESVDRPRPFVHELAALKEIASENKVVDAAVASIDPSSYQVGIPTSAQLVDRFRRVASEVRKAALLPEDAGAASHVASFVLSKVLFKKKGMAVGEDVESILTRTETFLEEGNIDEAAREMNGLSGWAKVLSRDWLGDCRQVLEVRQALDVIATEARLQSLLVE